MFSEILKELREDNNHTQADLAKLLGVAKSTVSNWEQKKSEPSFEQLCKICDIYKASADYLLGRSADDPQRRAERLNQLSEENKSHIRSYEKYLLSEQKSKSK
ncbi:MAG: helix-turn-helix transcriptional regulator [Clostridia bacterium]|nr:helix-turn-helix transcriptional regulator [Clostridia bacterium]